MRTLFIGGTKRGYMTLKGLLENRAAEIVGIISLEQDKHETERYEDLMRLLAQKYDIPLFQTKWMNDRDYRKIISETLRPEIALVVGCRLLLPKEIYEIPPQGTLAVHYSLLPEYRGFAPLQWPILNGETETGATLFYLNESMDGGDIVGAKRFPIGPDETAPEVDDKLCQAIVDVVLENFPLIAEGKARRIPQRFLEGSFACSRNPEDGLIDWNSPTREIYNKVRALTFPFTGAFTYHKNSKIIIWKASPVEPAPQYIGRIPGRVVHVSNEKGYVDVLTRDGILRIFEIQTADGQNKNAAEEIRSVKSTLRGLQSAEALDPQVNIGFNEALKKHGVGAHPYHPFAWITADPKIGEGTWIGAFCVIDGRGGLEIGKGCNISSGAHLISHSTAKRCISERQYSKEDKARTQIGDYVFVGENATVLMGSEIGHHSLIAAGTVVKEFSKIPPYSLVAGVPGRIVRSLKKEIESLKKGKKSELVKK